MISSSRSAFSLVEIAICLAILAFCLTALIGLMPAPLGSLRDADREAVAVRWLRMASTGIRGAVAGDDGICRPAGFGSISGISWTADGESVVQHEGYLDVHGDESEAALAVFSYRVRIVPPDDEDPASLGKAVLRIAWPATAAWSGTGWKNAQGEEQALVLFRTR